MALIRVSVLMFLWSGKKKQKKQPLQSLSGCKDCINIDEVAASGEVLL